MTPAITRMGFATAAIVLLAAGVAYASSQPPRAWTALDYPAMTVAELRDQIGDTYPERPFKWAYGWTDDAPIVRQYLVVRPDDDEITIRAVERQVWLDVPVLGSSRLFTETLFER